MKHIYQSFFVTMLALLISATAFAHDIEAVNADGVTIYYNWTNNQTELAVSYRGYYQNSYSNEYTDNIIIPESVVHNGTTYSVTSIGSSAFHDCSGLTSVTIPNSVTSIGFCAFQDCSGLTSIEIPNSVTCIRYSAFRNCSDMTSVTIPNSVTSIEDYAFNGCSGLTSVTILNPITSIESSAFNECNCLMSIKVRVTDYTAFCNNTRKSSGKPITLIDEDGQEITRFVIPDDVTSIEQSAFYDCSGLTSVTIPNSVTSIGQSAFLNCSGLTSVTIPNSVTSIGRSAFKDCTSLESVTIGDGVQSIDGDVFGNHRPAKIIWLTYTPPSGYSGAAGRVNYVANDQYTQLANKIVYKFLSSIFEVDGVKYVPVSPSERTCDAIDYIYDEQVSEVSINPTASYQGINMKVLNVQPYTFYQNPYLQKVNLDVSGRLSQYALSNCQNLQIALLGNNVTNIGDYAFSNCQKLESIIIPDAVNDIGQYAFSDCTNMASVIVGDGTETIGAHAFENCSNLTSATIGNSTRFIQQYAFSGCTLLPAISIPGSVRLIDDYTFQGCKSLKEIVVKDNNTNRRTTSFDPILVQLGDSKTITIDVAKGEELSFNYQWWQGSITISFLGKDIPHNGGSFKQIFNKDGKVSITLKTYHKPGYNAYCNITNMKLIESGSLLLGSNGNSPIFVDCPLDTVFIDRDLAYRSESNSGYSPFYNNSFLRSIEITNNGEEISDNEFFGCTNLQKVQIGDGVTSIGDWAFSGCSSLKSFSFGTNVRNIGKEAFSDCTSLTQLTSHATTPPICGEQALDDINKWTCKLTVPYGCIGIYQTADQWKEFFFIEEGEKTKEEIAINEENFPDKIFRSWLLSQSYGSDGVLTEEEIAGVSKIYVYGKSIQSLKGIEYFTSLTHLACSENQLTSIDVSKNTALTYLNCNSNQLTSLDVSKNTALTELYCYSNQLTSLDVSKNTALTELYCYSNQLTSLDVSKNTALIGLNCSFNQLTSLDVSKNTELTSLDCGSNQLTSLDLSKNTSLTELFCYNNLLTSLDVSKNSALTRLDCYSNQLTSLDVSKNTALTQLYCYSNQLTSLDLSGCTALTQLYCYQNRIKDDCMDALITSLPLVSNRTMYVIYNENEQNVMTTTQVAAAKAKGWRPLYYVGVWMEYVGSDPSGIQGIMLDKKVNVPIYDLNGRRLTEPQKGINIIGGKKILNH